MPKSETFLLAPTAKNFLQKLHLQFCDRRLEILAARNKRTLDSILLTAEATSDKTRALNWTVAPIPEALKKRTVEITGPAEPKMIIGALNSGADVFMADFEDSLSPTWENILTGHEALQAALRRTLTYTASETGKHYQLKTDDVRSERLATLIVRPRGWHLDEPEFVINGQSMSASLFDFGLYLFHGGKYGLQTGRGPFFYLPKMESREEAKLWADVFHWAEEELELPPQTILVTALIETLPAALQMEEILFELRDFIVGLNAGRWDYLFSMIKSTAGTRHEVTFPDRGRLTMEIPFMRAYAEKIVAVCDRRKATPIGGMSALIPSRKDAEINERALTQVRKDKEREARQGFQGTWVAHPDLVSIAREAFESTDREPTDGAKVEASPSDLLPKKNQEPFISFRPTAIGALLNIEVALRYISHWLSGTGAVAIHGLMEDAATAEISRAQLWQWRKKSVRLDTGEIVTAEWLISKIKETSLSIAESEIETAASLLVQLVQEETFQTFLTLPAMDRLRNNKGDQHEARI